MKKSDIICNHIMQNPIIWIGVIFISIILAYIFCN